MRYLIVLAALLLSCSTANVGPLTQPLPTAVQLDNGRWVDVLGWVDINGALIPVASCLGFPAPVLNQAVIADMIAHGVTEEQFTAAFSS